MGFGVVSEASTGTNWGVFVSVEGPRELRGLLWSCQPSSRRTEYEPTGSVSVWTASSGGALTDRTFLLSVAPVIVNLAFTRRYSVSDVCAVSGMLTSPSSFSSPVLGPVG